MIFMSEFKRHKNIVFFFSLGILILTGCQKPFDVDNYNEPEANVPDQWSTKLAGNILKQSDEADISQWWETFNDPYLNDLVTRSICENLDIKVALSRIAQSRINRAITAGEKKLNLDALGFYSQSMPSNYGLETIPGQNAHHSNLHNIGIDASWEIDVFGRIERAINAADADYQASIEDLYDVQSILKSDIVSTYIEVRTLQSRLYYARENVKSQSDTLELTQDRFDAQLVPQIDVQQAKLNLSRTQSSIPSLQIQINQAINRLATLLGEKSKDLLDEITSRKDLPEPSLLIKLDVPVDSVRRRPDVRASERRLYAQSLRVGVAETELYPKFSLSGSFAFEGTQLKHLGYDDSRKWSWGPSINWSLFNGDRLSNNILLEKERTEELLLLYKSTVLNALEDVENSLIAYNKESERKNILKNSVLAAKESVRLVNELYKSGLTDFQNVLDTERSLFEQQDEYASSSGSLLQNLVSLYKATGGGWEPLSLDAQKDEEEIESQ